jgi:hypothetical protein
MEAIAHSPSFAKKVGVPQSVGKDFSTADKGKTFKRGGDMATKMNPGFMAMMAKKKAGGGKMAAFEKSGKDVEKKGMKEGSKADMALDKKQMMGMKAGGMKKMAGGGSVDTGNKTSMTKVRTAAPSKDGVASKGKTQGKQIVMAGNKGMKRGGKVC